MGIRNSRHLVFLNIILFLFGASTLPARADPNEPISVIGHGAFFNHSFVQVAPTEKFLSEALRWYRGKYIQRLSSEKRADFESREKRALGDLQVDTQSRLAFDAEMVVRLVSVAATSTEDRKVIAKLNAIRSTLQFKLPSPETVVEKLDRELFKVDPSVFDRIKIAEFDTGGFQVLSATINSGQAYIDECSKAGVPTPPSIGQLDPAGLTGWKLDGFIPPGNQFIVGSQAQVRTFHSASPEGMCIALPRSTSAFNSNTIKLDGVICLGKHAPSDPTATGQGTSNVCFWDNQEVQNGNIVSFPYPNGTVIPIVAATGVKQMSGGKALEFGSGGTCTDCHAGQNPYVMHPAVPVMSNVTATLPTFGDTRYNPIVGSSWPQNDKSLTDAYVPTACTGCHSGSATSGHLPHLSANLPGFCGTILRQAVQHKQPPALPVPFAGDPPPTMPPFNPGSAYMDADLKTLINLDQFYTDNPNFNDPNPPQTVFDPTTFCGMGPTAGPSDRGDPHLVTTNNVAYDFQPAGEFTLLRDSDSKFEVQTRQTPIPTNPVNNAHNDLSSCVTINTAAAFKTSKHRISYQPGFGNLVKANAQNMQLRVDGAVTQIPNGGLLLDDGTAISVPSTGSGMSAKLADGSNVLIIPDAWSGYWFINVDVINTSAREGIMGHIRNGDWLPAAPNGTSFGNKPVTPHDRYVTINKKFADAWRVTKTTSLFDYGAGLQTANFTDKTWPLESQNCKVKGLNVPIQTKYSLPRAIELCSKIEDKDQRMACAVDVAVTGNLNFARSHITSVNLARQIMQRLENR